MTPQEALDELWQTLRAHYPMLEYAGAVGDDWAEALRPALQQATDLAAAYPLLERLVERLNDYHTRLEYPGKAPPLPRAPVRLGWIDGGLTVLAVDTPADGLAAGDLVLRLDGVPADAAFRAALVESHGPTPAARWRDACRRLVEGDAGSDLKLETAAGCYLLPRPARQRAPGTPQPPLLTWAAEDVAMLRVAGWGGLQADAFVAHLDARLEEARDAPCLVVDVRGNGGGSDALADACTGRFARQAVVSSISFWRQAGTNRFERSVEVCVPRGPWHYGGRFAVLTDEGCASACEHFVSGMEAAGACLVGTPTSGACGWMERIPLRSGATLICSRSFPLHGHTPSPMGGIPPHYQAPPTRADLRGGVDTALRTAIAWLRSGRPCPAAHGLSWPDPGPETQVPDSTYNRGAKV